MNKQDIANRMYNGILAGVVTRTNEQEGKLSVSYRDSLMDSEHKLTIAPGVKVQLS